MADWASNPNTVWLGLQQITKIMLGNQQVLHVYIGTTQVF